MAKQLIINIEDDSMVEDAIREVLKVIENGFTSGIIGCSEDTWELKDN